MNDNTLRLLIHVCCGPCAAWPLSALASGSIDIFGSTGIDATGLFYNPNIHPYDELKKRLEGAEKLFGLYNTPFIIRDDYMQDRWAREGSSPRCEMCYRLRLSYTAKLASEMGYDAFTTTLLISPYQNHELIASTAKEESLRNNIGFFYMDFRPHFREGQNMAREMGLYRQKYCGCIYST